MLNSDIGIDVDGIMYILFKKGSQFPQESSFIIELCVNEPTISFYQGQRAFVKYNKCIGKLNLINNKIGKFDLCCILNENKLIIIINDYTTEYTFINEMIGEINYEEDKVRDTEDAKLNYINYINQTLNTLEQIKDKIDPKLIDKVKYAKNIIWVNDVTIEEYNLAQKEIEICVNPIIHNLSAASTGFFHL
jgi:hypothetical protein